MPGSSILVIGKDATGKL